MTEKKPAIIVDLDSTLVNNTHRQKYLVNVFSGTPSQADIDTWQKFNDEIVNDTINEWCKRIILAFAKDHHILILTGRGEDVKITTEKWMTQNSVPYNELYMRDYPEFGDNSVEYKERILLKILKKYDVVLALDDEIKICEMFHRFEIPTLNVLT